VKGIAFVGALDALHEHGYTFRRIAGTSAGAIVAAILAALTQSGSSPRLLREYFATLDYARFRDDRALSDLRIGGPSPNALFRDGAYKGSYMREWLHALLREHGVETFGDLRFDEPDSGLPDAAGYSLLIIASDVSRNMQVRFPWDCAQYGIDADTMLVADAVRASASLPFFFEPFKMNVLKEDRWLIDGLVLSSVQVDIFDRVDARPSKRPTIAIKLTHRQRDRSWSGERRADRGERRSGDARQSSLSLLLNLPDALHVQEHAAARTIFVDTLAVRPTDFAITRETLEQLYENGRLAAEAWLRNNASDDTRS
jgi:NTE family protein